MLRFRRPAVAFLLLLTFWPTVVFGQAPKAGVVTTLEGNVTAARSVLPQPVPLRFKDDVFLRDKIVTGDQSLARLLLGGKAIVTIRERSILTVTELPGRSTVDLESGKIGLAVARDRMRQGEVIDVRTPNAIVAVRGTVLIAEVSRTTAQAGGTPPVVVTNAYILSGTAEATPLNPATGAPARPPFPLNPFQSFRVAGGAPPVIGTFTRADLGQIQSGLSPKGGPPHQEAANADQVKGQLLAATATLLATVLGGGVQPVEVIRSPTPPGCCVAPILPGGGVITSPSDVPSNITINPALAPFTTLSGSTPVVQTPPGTALALSSSAFEVETTGASPADLKRPLFDATNSNLTIGAEATESTPAIIANLLNVLGTLSSTGTQPVLSFDPTTITTTGDFIRVSGTLSVTSSLVNDTGGTLSAGGHFINVAAGGTLANTGSSPLVQLNNTTVTAAGDFLRIGSDASASAASVNLSGPLLKITNGALLIGRSTTNVIGNGGFESGFEGWTVFNQPGGSGDFFIQSGTVSPSSGFPVPAPPGGAFAAMSDQSGPGVHILYRDVTVPADSPILRFALFVGNRASSFASPNTITLPDFSGASPNQQVRVDLIAPAVGIQDVGAGVLRTLFQTRPGQPLVNGYRTFAVDLSDFAGQTVRLRFTEVDNQLFFQLGVDDVSLASGFNGFNLLRLDKGSVTKSGTDPLLVATQAVVATSGDLVALTRGAALTTSGPLLSATASAIAPGSGTVLSLSGGSTLSAGGPLLDLDDTFLVLSGPVARLSGTSTLKNTAGPVIRISAGSLMADALVSTDGAHNTLNLTGSLLDLSNTTVTLGALTHAPCDCVPTDAFTHALGINEAAIRMSSSDLTLRDPGAPLVSLGVDTGGPIEQSGVALIATGTESAPSTITLNGILLDLGGVKLTDPNPQAQVTHTTIHQRGPNALIEVLGLPVTAAGPLLKSAASTFEIERSSLLAVNGQFTVNGEGSGALLQFTDSSVTTGAEVAFVGPGGKLTLDRGLVDARNTRFLPGVGTFGTFFAVAQGATVTASTPSPFIALDGGTVTQPGQDFIHIGTNGAPEARAVLTLTGGGPLLRLANVAAGHLNIGSGTLLRATGSDLTAGGSLLDMINSQVSLAGPVISMIDSHVSTTGPVLSVEGGSTITTTAGPVVKISGGSLTADTLATTDGADNTINLTGTLLDLTNTTVTLRRLGQGVTGNITLGLDEPFIRLVGSTLNVSEGDLLTIAPDQTGATFQGVALTADPSTLTLGGRLLRFRGTVSVTGASPLIQLTGSKVNTTAANSLIEVEPNAGVTLAKPLLSASSSTINALSGGVLTIGSNASLTASAAAASTVPLMSFTGGSVASTAGNLVAISGNPGGAATMTLQRPFLVATNAALSAFFNFFRIGDGASVCAAPSCGGALTSPFIQISGGTYIGGASNGTGDLLRMFSLSNQQPTSFTLTNGFLSASGGATLSASNGVFVDIRDSATLTSTGTMPFLDFSNASATAAFSFFAFGPGLTPAGASGTNVPPVLSFAGQLFRAADTGSALTFSTSNSRAFLSIFDGATVTDMGTDAFLNLTGTTPGKVVVNAASDLVFLGATTSGKPAPSLMLFGPLISAQNATLTSGNPASNTFTNIFVGDGAQLKELGNAPLMSFTNSTLTTAGNVLTVRRSPSTSTPTAVTLAGPLLIDSGSTFRTTSLGLGAQFSTSLAPCCSGFFIGQGAQLTSSAAAPLIQLSGSTFISQDNVQSGRDFFTLSNTCCGGANPGELVAPASLSLTNPGGSLLSVTDGSIKTLFSLLNVQRSSVMSSGTGPLIQFGGATGPTVTLGGFDPIADSTAIGRLLTLIDSSSPGVVVPSPASVSLAGPLLVSTNASITTTSDLIGVFNGATLVTNPNPSRVYPLVSLSGGSLTVGTIEAPPGHIFNLVGRPENVVAELDPVTHLPTGLNIGQDEPLQHGGGGALLEMLNVGTSDAPAKVSGSIVRLVDAQLLAATLPAVANLTNTTLTTGSHAVDLVRNAKFDVGLADVVRLTNSAMTVLNGHLLNINASRHNAGTLAALAGGSTLNILNGALLNLMNGGIANFGISLVSFTNSGNTINVTNSFAPNFFFTGLPVFVAPTIATVNGAPNPNASPGATGVANISINGPPIIGLGTAAGTINLRASGTPTFTPLPTGATSAPASLITVQGTGGTLKIGTAQP